MRTRTIIVPRNSNPLEFLNQKLGKSINNARVLVHYSVINELKNMGQLCYSTYPAECESGWEMLTCIYLLDNPKLKLKFTKSENSQLIYWKMK